LQTSLEDKDEGHLKFMFFTIMSQKGSALLKQLQNSIEKVFDLVNLDDRDKEAGSNSRADFNRELNIKMTTFKKFIDLEESQKVSGNHESRIQFNKLRLVHEIAVMISLVRVYYIKKEQEKGLSVQSKEEYSTPNGVGYIRMIESVKPKKKDLMKRLRNKVQETQKSLEIEEDDKAKLKLLTTK